VFWNTQNFPGSVVSRKPLVSGPVHCRWANFRANRPRDYAAGCEQAQRSKGAPPAERAQRGFERAAAARRPDGDMPSLGEKIRQRPGWLFVLRARRTSSTIHVCRRMYVAAIHGRSAWLRRYQLRVLAVAGSFEHYRSRSAVWTSLRFREMRKNILTATTTPKKIAISPRC